MKIILGADHGGFELKEFIKYHLLQESYVVEDVGIFHNESVDYPSIAYDVAMGVIDNTNSITYDSCIRGILFCGTGIGMSITANRLRGIRAAVVSDPFSAEMSRAHNDSNILCLGGRVVGNNLALSIVKTWLNTPFRGQRHQRRIDLIDSLYKMEFVK